MLLITDPCFWLCQAYSGSSDEETSSFYMNYQLEGDPSQLSAMCKAIGDIIDVRSWAVGCGLPESYEQLEYKVVQ